ncbi:HAD-IA family hydrolase [Streptomyces sp. NPDC048718]|uniref:HAD-IA family hydrolase n=1 Tax=Streptomyces sp. NPDC048718 TaxID=3365587 RepID=UPI0037122791
MSAAFPAAAGHRSAPTVWFDFGGVLSPPLPELFRSFEKKTGITPEQMYDALAEVERELGVPVLEPIELGTMPETEWAALLSAALRHRWPEVDQSRADWRHFGRQWFDGITVDEDMAAAAGLLHQEGFRVGVLSNNVREWGPYWKKMIGSVPFDVMVDSCDHGVRKPQPEIYELAERTARVAADDCVLIDDLAENCAAAEAAGWTTVHFRDTRQALLELSAITGVRLCRLP